MKHLLPVAEVEQAIKALDEAFHGMRRHDLWDEAGKLICADSKDARLEAVRLRGLDTLGFKDLDYLMSSVGLTIGTRETVRYLTPRYLKALLSYPQFGWYTAGDMLRYRLERYGFDDWPREQRRATAEALILMGRAMVLMADEFSEETEADGAGLIAWAEARRDAAIAEAAMRKHKATMKRHAGRRQGLRR